MSRILYLVVLVLAIVAILDIVRSSKDNEKKVLWIVLVVFLPVLGVILYYAIGRK